MYDWKRLCLIGVIFCSAILASLAFTANACAAEPLPARMLIEVDDGQSLADYVVLPRGKKPENRYLKKPRFEIVSGREAFLNDPARFEQRLEAAGTFCVRYRLLPDPGDYIGTSSVYDEFTWVYDPNYWGKYAEGVMTRDRIRELRSEILDACREVIGFGRQYRTWGEYPDAVRVPVTAPGFEEYETLVLGFTASKRPDFDQVMRSEDRRCVRILSQGRPGRYGTAPSNSDYVLTKVYAPEFSVSGRGAVPPRFNEELLETEYDRCRDADRWLRRKER